MQVAKYHLDKAVIGRLQAHDIAIRTRIKKWKEWLLIRDVSTTYTNVLEKRYDSYQATKDEMVLLHLVTCDLGIPFVMLDDFGMPGLKLTGFVIYVYRSNMMFALLNKHIKQVPSWVATITNEVMTSCTIDISQAKVCSQYIFAACFLSMSKLAYTFRQYLPRLGLSKYFTEQITDLLVDKTLGEGILESKIIEVIALLKINNLITQLQLTELEPFSSGGAGRVYDWIATNNSEVVYNTIREAGCEQLYVQHSPKLSPQVPIKPIPKSPPVERHLPALLSSSLPIYEPPAPSPIFVPKRVDTNVSVIVPSKSEDDSCPVCMDNKTSRIALIPCGHMGICDKCLSELPTSNCPICNTVFTSKHMIFKVSS